MQFIKPLLGTTWTSALLWLLLNDCDMGKDDETPLTMRSSFLE